MSAAEILALILCLYLIVTGLFMFVPLRILARINSEIKKHRERSQ